MGEEPKKIIYPVTTLLEKQQEVQTLPKKAFSSKAPVALRRIPCQAMPFRYPRVCLMANK